MKKILSILNVAFLCVLIVSFSVKSTRINASSGDLIDISDLNVSSFDMKKLADKPFKSDVWHVKAIGHRNVIQLDKSYKPVYRERIISMLTAWTETDSFRAISIEQTKEWQSGSSTMTSTQVKIGIEALAKVAVNLEPIATASRATGLNAQLSKITTHAYSSSYTEITSQDYDINLNLAFKDHDAIGLAYVGDYIRVKVKVSYEEKNWWNKWWSIGNTKQENYYAYYLKGHTLRLVYRDKLAGGKYKYGYGNTNIGYHSTSMCRYQAGD